jgi:hypothetical protein
MFRLQQFGATKTRSRRHNVIYGSVFVVFVSILNVRRKKVGFLLFESHARDGLVPDEPEELKQFPEWAFGELLFDLDDMTSHARMLSDCSQVERGGELVLGRRVLLLEPEDAGVGKW